MNKQQLQETYKAASQFRLWRDGADKFSAMFPTIESLMSFYDAIAKTSWPEFYGQSPYDDAFGIAYNVKHGLSENSKGFLKSRLDEQSTKNKIACLALFGISID